MNIIRRLDEGSHWSSSMTFYIETKDKEIILLDYHVLFIELRMKT